MYIYHALPKQKLNELSEKKRKINDILMDIVQEKKRLDLSLEYHIVLYSISTNTKL